MGAVGGLEAARQDHQNLIFHLLGSCAGDGSWQTEGRRVLLPSFLCTACWQVSELAWPGLARMCTTGRFPRFFWSGGPGSGKVHGLAEGAAWPTGRLMAAPGSCHLLVFNLNFLN
jgi:hypothetical protein